MNRAQRRRPQPRQLAKTRNRHPAWIRWSIYLLALAVVLLFVVAFVQARQVHVPPSPAPAIR